MDRFKHRTNAPHSESIFESKERKVLKIAQVSNVGDWEDGGEMNRNKRASLGILLFLFLF